MPYVLRVTLRFWERRSVRRAIGASAVGVCLAGVCVVGLTRAPAPVTVEEAVRQFRASQDVPVGPSTTLPAPPAETVPSLAPEPALVNEEASEPIDQVGGNSSTAPTPPAVPPRREPALPERGVYVYDTTGSEQVNYPGSRRSYSRTTTITVVDAECGVEYRWRANEEHTDSSVVCVKDDSLALVRYMNTNSFYGRTHHSSYLCGDGASYGYPHTGTPGQRWTYTCRTSSGDTTLSVVAEIIEFVPVHVANAPVDTMHVRHTTEFAGAQRGTTVAELWYALDDARIIQNTARIAVDADGPFGTVEYRSDFQLTLADPDPQQ